jgi:protein gp37
VRNALSGVILGAQSGKNAVTLNLDWVRTVRGTCATAGVPFMFKQDNSTGKVVTLPELDGQQHTALAWTVEG